MDQRNQRNLKNLFQSAVFFINDDDDYYAKLFNIGIRLLGELGRLESHVAYAELLYVFEKYVEWTTNREHMDRLRRAIVVAKSAVQ